MLIHEDAEGSERGQEIDRFAIKPYFSGQKYVDECIYLQPYLSRDEKGFFCKVKFVARAESVGEENIFLLAVVKKYAR